MGDEGGGGGEGSQRGFQNSRQGGKRYDRHGGVERDSVGARRDDDGSRPRRDGGRDRRGRFRRRRLRGVQGRHDGLMKTTKTTAKMMVTRAPPRKQLSATVFLRIEGKKGSFARFPVAIVASLFVLSSRKTTSSSSLRKTLKLFLYAIHKK